MRRGDGHRQRASKVLLGKQDLLEGTGKYTNASNVVELFLILSSLPVSTYVSCTKASRPATAPSQSRSDRHDALSPLPLVSGDECFSSHNTRWYVAAGWRSLLFGPNAPLWVSLAADLRAEVVKRAPHRTVHRLELNGRRVYVKHFRGSRWSDILRAVALGSPARREGRRLREVAHRGVPTSRLLAWGERRRFGFVTESYLVTEAIEDVSTLGEYLTTRLPALTLRQRVRAKRRLLDGLAGFLAQMHRAGIRHNDLHSGNILVSCPTAAGESVGAPAFHLIDVASVRIGGPLSWPSAAKSLAGLAAIGRHCTTRTERLRFWRDYVSRRPGLCPPTLSSVIAEVEKGSRQFLRELHRRRDRRAVHTNRDYRSIHHEGVRLHALQDLPDDALLELSRCPDAPIWRHVEQPVKLSHSTLIVKATLPTRGGPMAVAYKCYRPRNGWKSLCRLFGRDRARRSWRLGQALFEREIPTARPLVMISPRRPWFGRRTYLATEWLEGAENLHLYGWRVAARDPQERSRRASQCARSLGRLLGRMHAWGISHGDLKATNLLVAERGDQLDTYVIDVDDVRLTRRLLPRSAAADLSRLAVGLAAHPWVTRTTCCRFLREYARNSPRRDRLEATLGRDRPFRRPDRLAQTPPG